MRVRTVILEPRLATTLLGALERSRGGRRRSLVVTPAPKSKPPLPPGGSRARAASLVTATSAPARPWRYHDR